MATILIMCQADLGAAAGSRSRPSRPARSSSKIKTQRIREAFKKAFSACFDARGYAVR